MRTVVLRVVALALLLLLALFSAIAVRTLQRLPDLTVYFVKDLGTSFTIEPVHVSAGRMNPEERARQQIEALRNGPEPDSGLSSVVPQGTRLLEASLDSGILTVNLSREFEAGGGTASMIGRLYQVFYTVTRPADVQGVSLQIEGQTVHIFSGDGLIVEQPWIRSEFPLQPEW